MVNKVSVSSLQPAEKEGFLKKQGDHYRTWKKRWFVLKGRQLYYFETPKDSEPKGVIDLEPNSIVRDEQANDKKHRKMFSVSTARRIFYIYSKTEDDMRAWMDAVQQNIHKIASTPGGNDVTAARLPAVGIGKPGVGFEAAGTVTNAPPRARLAFGKNCIPYLLDESSKVLEFWQIWTESIPLSTELLQGMMVDFYVAASADLQKLTWRSAGPQNVFIQKMVDFFWNVGAPESEIDRLNEIGGAINPVTIGSWIDMSGKGGMDGGWFFPVETPLKTALEAADAGEPTKKVAEWAEHNSIPTCQSVGRDMGAAPPRQTELRFQLPGTDFTNQLRIAMDAFFAFGFPAISEDALACIRKCEGAGPISMSVITSSEGFVRLGVLLPRPSEEVVRQFCTLSDARADEVLRFQHALGNTGPAFVEYQFLMKGFGYNVYKEGFDVVFHYTVGHDRGEAAFA